MLHSLHNNALQFSRAPLVLLAKYIPLELVSANIALFFSFLISNIDVSVEQANSIQTDEWQIYSLHL